MDKLPEASERVTAADPHSENQASCGTEAVWAGVAEQHPRERDDAEDGQPQ